MVAVKMVGSQEDVGNSLSVKMVGCQEDVGNSLSVNGLRNVALTIFFHVISKLNPYLAEP